METEVNITKVFQIISVSIEPLRDGNLMNTVKKDGFLNLVSIEPLRDGNVCLISSIIDCSGCFNRTFEGWKQVNLLIMMKYE